MLLSQYEFLYSILVIKLQSLRVFMQLSVMDAASEVDKGDALGSCAISKNLFFRRLFVRAGPSRLGDSDNLPIVQSSDIASSSSSSNFL